MIGPGAYFVYDRVGGPILLRVRSKRRGLAAWTCDQVVSARGDRVRTPLIITDHLLRERGTEVLATSDGDAYAAYLDYLKRRAL